MIPKLYSNQKAIRIAKTECNKDNPYAVINLAALEGAMKALKPNAFKVWCYLCRNQTNYEFALSGMEVQTKCNMSDKTYRSAVNELIEKQYLVEVELYEGLTGYLFIDKGYGGE